MGEKKEKNSNMRKVDLRKYGRHSSQGGIPAREVPFLDIHLYTSNFIETEVGKGRGGKSLRGEREDGVGGGEEAQGKNVLPVTSSCSRQKINRKEGSRAKGTKSC